MASLIPGFKYDIFISYRHNDNRSGWVTDFVKALQEELAGTIKSPISVYFDTNPHDGLLEMHNVDKSLEGKLKCIIFIPIISQTYCDQKSFAWQQEFCVFNKMAQADSLGKDIRLANGNVSSRILPIIIHDLDAEDKSTIEIEIGGALRGIELIYKEPGVNRPLKPTDQKADNLNKTDYRNQVNKVANAVKELVAPMRSGLVNEGVKSFDRSTTSNNRHNLSKKKWGYAALLAMLIAAAGYFAYDTIVAGDTSTSPDKSIAVLPFTDLTPDHQMEYFGDGIADEVINSLTTIKDLKVAGRTSSFQFKGEKVDIRTIGEKLKVAFVLEGTVQKYEDNFRITAQLIRTSDNFHAWSKRFDMKEVNVFKIQDAIAASIVDKLRLTLTDSEKRQLPRKESNPEAYVQYLRGVYQFKFDNHKAAAAFFARAIELDPDYAPPYALMGICIVRSIDRTHRDSIELAVNHARRAIELDPDLPEGYSAMGLIAWMGIRDFKMAGEYFEKSIQLNPSVSFTKNRYGYFLTWMGDFKKSTRMAKEALELDPVDWNSYQLLFFAAYYQKDIRTVEQVLVEHRQVFGANHQWINNSNYLDKLRNKPEAVIRRIDSLQKQVNNLGIHVLALKGMCYFKMGKIDKSDSVMSAIRKMKPYHQAYYYQRAKLYAVQGKVDSCLKDLERSIQRYEIEAVAMKVDLEFIPLHLNPKYIKFCEVLGFNKYTP